MKSKLNLQIKKAPQRPGIYIFSAKDEVLYIGKASNLKKRLKQYSNKKAYSPFLEPLLNQAEKIETEMTGSEIEALILESRLIKKHRPKYNIMLRDDKEYFYVVFTKEEFPKIFITHQPWAVPSEALVKEGPFTDGTALKTTLKLLRRIFPYCTCTEKHHNFCLNYHIGKCPGFCCLKTNQELNIKNKNDILKIKGVYKENIRTIKDILSGRRKSLVKELKKELNQLAKNQEFEKAIELRNKVEKLERVFENAKIINLKTNDMNVLIELKKMFKLSGMPRRIEGYDISNIQGKNAVGAMVVFTDGQPDKNQYRKFKIRFKKESDDIAMLKEILARRLNHPEWKYPDLIFIDGGKGQLNAAKSAISQKVPIISLAKGKNEVFSDTLKNPVSIKRLPAPVQNLIKQIDSEAHRFAISYYRKIHRKRLIA